MVVRMTSWFRFLLRDERVNAGGCADYGRRAASIARGLCRHGGLIVSAHTVRASTTMDCTGLPTVLAGRAWRRSTVRAPDVGDAGRRRMGLRYSLNCFCGLRSNPTNFFKSLKDCIVCEIPITERVLKLGSKA